MEKPSHLYSFRKGWENENLARFILSQFSFVSSPSSISDDIGTDFFCNLFKIITDSQPIHMIPINFFAIQIKSNNNKINVSNKIDYFDNLEIPFFVGIVDKNKLSMNIYSGEYIPFLFSFKGLPKNLFISCVNEPVNNNYYETKNGNTYLIKFPFVVELSSNESIDNLKNKINILSSCCKLMLKNIASRISKEYIFFSRESPIVQIFSGPGSNKEFRTNFLWRLCEVFHNLIWEFDNRRDIFNVNEFYLFERFLLHLKEIGTIEPDIISKPYNELKDRINVINKSK
jgi:hypothetical protein